MPSIISGFEYDIFISYRQKDNKGDRWVTEFVGALKTELEATFKEDLSIYFDENPHDGLLETHDVDDSLKDKLKCLIFIPIISQTYCDPKSFAWTHEFLAFKRITSDDQVGLKVKLSSGNVASRILPVRIHELDSDDRTLIESEVGPLRSIDFIFKSAGVNRPLRAQEDHPSDNTNKTYYRDQVNKVANAIKEIIASCSNRSGSTVQTKPERSLSDVSITRRSKKIGALVGIAFVLSLVIYFILTPVESNRNNIDQSVAVLPFDNFSTSDETQYFADGVMVAVLNNLSKIKDLKVISRTSVEIYRETTKSVKEIAKELKVNHVIQGNVQRDGNKVRVTVQLINAADDDQIWSENYDRNLEDIFSIQSDIAQNVSKQLQVTLRSNEKKLINAMPSYDLNAYDEFLRGKDKLAKYFLFHREDDYNNGVRYLKLAIAHDSSLSEAYSELAFAEFDHNGDRDFLKESYGDSVIYLANKALSINPHLSQGYLLRGLYYVSYNSSFEQAEKEFRYAIELDPNNAQTYISFGYAFAFIKPALALENLLIGLRLDPNTYERPIIYANLSWIYITAGLFEIAESYALKSLEIEPGYRDGYRALVHSKMVQSKIDEAHTICEDWKKLSQYALRYLQEIYVFQKKYKEAEKCFIEYEKLYPDEFNYKQRYGVVLWKLGKQEQSLAKFEEAIKEYELMIQLKRPQMISAYYDLAGVYAFIGKKDEAYKWMKKWDQFGLLVGLETYASIDPLFENVKNDEVFKNSIEKAKKMRIGLANQLKEIAARFE